MVLLGLDGLRYQFLGADQEFLRADYEFMMASKSFVFRFDDVEVREREFTLIKAGKVLTVEPKAFRALLFLLHNPQRLISKEELLNAVWGDAAVTEGSLTRCIWLLRSVLGDDIRSRATSRPWRRSDIGSCAKVEVSEEAARMSLRAGRRARRSGAALTTNGWKPRDGVGSGCWRCGCVLPRSAWRAVAIWYLRRPLPPPRISRYTQITHDGHEKNLAGTDGSRLYFNQMSGAEPGFIAQVAISGREYRAGSSCIAGAHFCWTFRRMESAVLIELFSIRGVDQLPLWNVRILGGSARRIAVADSRGLFARRELRGLHPERRRQIGSSIYIARSDGTGASQTRLGRRRSPPTSPGRRTVARSGLP